MKLAGASEPKPIPSGMSEGIPKLGKAAPTDSGTAMAGGAVNAF
jgi:hypothetical protein